MAHTLSNESTSTSKILTNENKPAARLAVQTPSKESIMKRIDQINSRGYANGWHAEQLQARAARQGETMADCFKRETLNSAGFNVPAQCVKVTKNWIHYQFADGSKARFYNQSGKV